LRTKKKTNKQRRRGNRRVVKESLVISVERGNSVGRRAYEGRGKK